MTWGILRALILGFALSAVVQAVVCRCCPQLAQALALPLAEEQGQRARGRRFAERLVTSAVRYKTTSTSSPPLISAILRSGHSRSTVA
jgi:hypothetical protein